MVLDDCMQIWQNTDYHVRTSLASCLSKLVCHTLINPRIECDNQFIRKVVKYHCIGKPSNFFLCTSVLCLIFKLATYYLLG